MKRCTHCGKEYPDNTNFCPIDGHAVIDPANPPPSIPPPTLLKSGPQKLPDAPKKPADVPKSAGAPKKSAAGRYQKFEDVPWYRREPGALAMIGVLFCGVVILVIQGFILWLYYWQQNQ
jgi:hypothetical protein